MAFVSDHVVHRFSSIDTTITWKKSCFISLDRSDYHIIDILLIVHHALKYIIIIAFFFCQIHDYHGRRQIFIAEIVVSKQFFSSLCGVLIIINKMSWAKLIRVLRFLINYYFFFFILLVYSKLDLHRNLSVSNSPGLSSLFLLILIML